MAKPRILIVSTNPPFKEMGGSILFYRQFILRDDYEVAVISDRHDRQLDTVPWLPARHRPLLLRLMHTRISLWAHDYIHYVAGHFPDRDMIAFAEAFKPDLIVGTAETWMMDVALSLGKRLNVPVTGFFMDWPTYASLAHSWAKRGMTWLFRRRYRKSAAAFCICPEMRDALGPHPNAHIYYPSNDWQEPRPLPARTGDHPYTLMFAGNLGQWYGHAITALIDAIEDHPHLALRVAGANAPWSAEREAALREAGVFLGFLTDQSFRDALASADALLVVMGFDEESRQIESTSFKSKIVEYILTGRPLVIWGPEWCTAVQHARLHDFGEVVTSQDPAGVVEVMERLRADPARQQELIDKGQAFYRECLDPDKVFGGVKAEFERLIAANRRA